MREMKITQASEHDRGITVRTAQLESNLVFTDGDEYYLKIKDLPFAIPMTLNRGGDSLYSGALDPYIAALIHIAVGMPRVGRPTIVEASLGKNLKTVTG